ncbi:hypothetical protein PMKS-002193 [Pichia membranifaciens]|uniref:ubiquitinyl hydrolase 1 n=1 Tax=Pichia membranifaciens TaxID=4926 RepID=A0A1Q2YGP5_9ASCO|nr:hypothetical protein PMKS-002193 [Pichia membranifaciens]
MLGSSQNNGVLLFDDAVPKAQIKLSTERKSLSKQIGVLVQSNLGKTVARDPSNQRLINVLIVLLNLDLNTHANVLSGYKFFRLYQLSSEGKLITCKGEYKNKHKEISLVGMDNYSNTTCYLDSLLVALFYSNTSFDFLLDKTIDPNLSPEFQQQIERMKIVLRFIVNLLRAGELINSNIMYQLLVALDSLGCDIALSRRQQDSLQIFEFLAESLSLPLLTLKLDIIHTGKLNVNDDLRLIGERSLLISIPSSPASNDNPITLEECLNTYFNNSITVRRHIDQQLGSTSGSKIRFHNSEVICSSGESLAQNKDEINEYEKLGILTSSSSSKASVPIPISIPSSLTPSISAYWPNTSQTPFPTSESSVVSPEQVPITPQQSSQDSSVSPTEFQLTSTKSILRTPSSSKSGSEFETPTGSQSKKSLPNTGSSVIDLSPDINNVTGTDLATLDSVNVVGSFRNVTEKMERQRTRSSTLASVLNNVQSINPKKLTRRSSSISNAEVSLPAWMYLQLLPYYTDPEVKLTVENHEEYYRRRVSRSKTIDSAQNISVGLPDKASNDDSFDTDAGSYFGRRFANRRPMVPICLKRYIWNERGQSVKIDRKVTIPQIIKYPYFIAEDKKKPGYIDFRRSCDNQAPRGSFMLVLQSCVCHRGNSTNSGHYVSLIRKRRFDVYHMDANSEWLIFNDMETGRNKAQSCTFEEAMDKESPYILFYEIYEIKDDGYQTPIGGKESYWNRKRSVNSGFSGYSEQTLHEDPQEENKSTTSTKHMMHLSLAGLTLSKSRSKNIGSDLDDVLDEYFWYGGPSDRNSSNFKSNYSLNTNISGRKEDSSTEQASTHSASSTTSLPFPQDESVPQVHIMEVGESSSTNVNGSSEFQNGRIEYTIDPIDDSKDKYDDGLASDDEEFDSARKSQLLEVNSGINSNVSAKNSKTGLYTSISHHEQKRNMFEVRPTQSHKSVGTIKTGKTVHNDEQGGKSTSEGAANATIATIKNTKGTKKKSSLARKGTVKKLLKKVFS